MRRLAPNTASPRRGGYTLLELLLVLAILVMAAGIALPSVMGMYQRNRLDRAAEDVRARLAGTRFWALDSGLIYQFRFEPAGRRYLVISFDQPGDAAEAAARQRLGQLPDSMRFETADAEVLFVEQIPLELLSGLANSQELAGVSWSPPILFIPDGSAMDSVFDLVDSAERFVRFRIRGLTGTVKVEPIRKRTGQ